jgi:23S rRNA (cytosine1962-C5)-methyltransferase
VVLRLSRIVERGKTYGLTDGAALAGEAPTAAVPFLENGLQFEAAVVGGHKTGFFLDQRDNRALVRSLSRSARVLDVFSYNGGFSVSAAAGGATSVTSVDQSEPALAAARATFARNRDDPSVASCRHTTVAGDAFTIMRDLAARGEHFDIVIVDPPSFAQKRADVEQALRAYGTLTWHCRCSSPGLLFWHHVHHTADASSPPCTAAGRRRTDRAPHRARRDHPIGFAEGPI